MKLTFLIIMMFGYLSAMCQKDSTWHIDLMISHRKGIIPETRVSFINQELTSVIKRNHMTFVPSLSRKSVHGISGLQLGLGYYQKFNCGYLHASFHYSKSLIFSTINSKNELNVNVLEKLSLGAGLQYTTYRNGESQFSFKLGPTFYYRNWMGIYNTMITANNPLGHKVLIRKSLHNPEDFIQAFYFHGVSLDQLINGVNLNTVSNSLVFSLHKNLSKKLQLHISIGTVFSHSEQTQNQYFNYSLGLQRKL